MINPVKSFLTHGPLILKEIYTRVAGVESKGEGEKKGEGIGENRKGNSLFISLSRFSFAFATQATCF